MPKQPVIRIEDIKDIAEVMTRTEISEVEKSFVRQAQKAKESKVNKLVVEEIEINDRNAEKEEEGR